MWNFQKENANLKKLKRIEEFKILSGDEKLNFCLIVLDQQLFYSFE